MLNKLSQIDKSAKSMMSATNALNHQSSKGHAQAKHFNASLPVLLKVIAKSQGNNYLLKLGNTTIQTQSQRALQVGKTYWANMQQNAAGQIVLNKLIAKPDFSENLKSMPLKLAMKDLDLLAKDYKAFGNELKEFLLQNLGNVAHKEDFSQLSMMALSLAQGVLSLVVNEDGEDKLLQIAPKKQSVDFYAIFPRLGPVQGQIYTKKEAQDDNKAPKSLVCADICVMNERVKELLESHAKELGLDEVQIYCDKTPEELFAFKNNLLDIHG